MPREVPREIAMTPDTKGPWIALYTKTIYSQTFNFLTCVERSVFLQGFLLAARMEYDCLYKRRFYHILPGQFVISQRDLATQCGEGCTRQIVRSTIDKLVAAQTWTHQRAKSGAQSPSLITFINWSVYQRPLTMTTQSRTHRATKLQPTDGIQPLINGGENASLHSSYKDVTVRPSFNGSKKPDKTEPSQDKPRKKTAAELAAMSPSARGTFAEAWDGLKPAPVHTHVGSFNPDHDEDSHE
jgi:hypothetical protein